MSLSICKNCPMADFCPKRTRMILRVVSDGNASTPAHAPMVVRCNRTGILSARVRASYQAEDERYICQHLKVEEEGEDPLTMLGYSPASDPGPDSDPAGHEGGERGSDKARLRIAWELAGDLLLETESTSPDTEWLKMLQEEVGDERYAQMIDAAKMMAPLVRRLFLPDEGRD